MLYHSQLPRLWRKHRENICNRFFPQGSLCTSGMKNHRDFQSTCLALGLSRKRYSSRFLTEIKKTALQNTANTYKSCLQSVMNAAARLVFTRHQNATTSRRFYMPITLAESSMAIDYKLAVLVFKCLHGLGPSYLADELHHPAELAFWMRLCSASSHELSVPRTRRSTYGVWAFPVTAVRIEQSSAAYHICCVTSCLLLSLEDTSSNSNP